MAGKTSRLFIITGLYDFYNILCESHIILDTLYRLLRIVPIEADKGGVWKMCGHLLEGEADNNGSVKANPEFQEQEPLVGCCTHEVAVALGLPMPVAILYEGIVTT